MLCQKKKYGSISLISLLKAKSCADSSFSSFCFGDIDNPYDILHHLQSVKRSHQHVALVEHPVFHSLSFPDFLRICLCQLFVLFVRKLLAK